MANKRLRIVHLGPAWVLKFLIGSCVMLPTENKDPRGMQGLVLLQQMFFSEPCPLWPHHTVPTSDPERPRGALGLPVTRLPCD